MGPDHSHDGRPGCRYLGIRRTRSRGCIRAGIDKSRVILSDHGSAVVAGVINIAFATLITLSVLALALSGYYSLAIRDAAIDAASKSARFGAGNQSEYLMQRLDVSVPELASFRVSQGSDGQLSHVVVDYGLPGFGLLGNFNLGRVSVAAATERL